MRLNVYRFGLTLVCILIFAVILYDWILCLQVYMPMYAFRAHGTQKRASALPYLELQMVVGCQSGA